MAPAIFGENIFCKHNCQSFKCIYTNLTSFSSCTKRLPRNNPSPNSIRIFTASKTKKRKDFPQSRNCLRLACKESSPNCLISPIMLLNYD